MKILVGICYLLGCLFTGLATGAVVTGVYDQATAFAVVALALFAIPVVGRYLS